MPLFEQQQRGLVAKETATLAITEAIAQLQLSPPTQTTPISPPGLLAIGAAVSVLTNASLLSNIGSFQEDPLTFVTEYKMKILGPDIPKQVGVDSLVYLAIRRKDRHALKMMYTARLLHPDTVNRPELSFEAAMDDAVREGHQEIIQWLHARSQQQHRIPIRSTPGAFTLSQILQCSRMDIVRWLFDLHDDRIDQRFLKTLQRAFYRSPGSVEPHATDDSTRHTNQKKRQQPSPYSGRYAHDWGLPLLRLFVQQRPALHSTLLTLAAEAGSVSVVSYMLNPRSGIDTTTTAMLPSILAAARGGHHDLIEMLFAAKRADEVIDVAVLREQLRSVGDASALQLLLRVVAQRDPAVQQQLEAERDTASALFGVAPSSAPTTKRKSAKAGRR